MKTKEIEKKLIELDRELHTILKLIEEEKEEKKGVVESARGAWGYEVDSVEFVREMRKSKDVGIYKKG